MKLAKEISTKFQAESRPAINTLLLTGLIASSFLTGCSSMLQKADENSEPVASTASAPSDSVASAEDKKNAAALMATLSAPIQEPMAKKQEPMAKKSETINPKPVADVKVAQVKTELNVAEVKKEVVPVVEVKPIEKPVVEAPKEKVTLKPAIEKIVTAKKETHAKRALQAKPLNVSVKDLPVNYDIWQFKQGVAALEKGIVVSTPTWGMGKEGYNSQIWLTIMENQILINSSSDIDLSAGDLGIEINGGPLIPFTRLEGNNIGVLEGQWLAQLQKGGKMDIFLAFFPGKTPQSDVFKTDVSLESLKRVIPTYRKLLW
ncbi:MAG: hypothetical protein ACI9T9_000724 [Oleiphilaceae bacterium]|jgi:hypothetical protein